MQLELLLLSALCYGLAGATNGWMDTLQFHFSTSIFTRWNALFWDPKVSWRNKYQDGLPEQGPKFPGSTTIFVSLTDGWHLAQMCYFGLQRTAIILDAAAFHAWSDEFWSNAGIWATGWIILALLHSAGFHLTYSFILKDRDSR